MKRVEKAREGYLKYFNWEEEKEEVDWIVEQEITSLRRGA